MSNKTILNLTISSLIALSLTGCATEQKNADQALSTTKTAVNSAQSATGLTDSLVQQLGVSPLQASAGTGALLQVAQAKMPGNDFQQLTQSVPELGGLLNAVQPKPSSLSQLASGASSLMGDESNSLGAAVNLAETYQKLGLSSDMVGQFIPIITDYVSKSASPQLTQSLISSLTGL
ncbi:MAG: DUF2780 domain-containing protein [Methyloprofundus sp.]|nr:DUF2780 domain-containing protein [Methyloprofundus sp.]